MLESHRWKFKKITTIIRWWSKWAFLIEGLFFFYSVFKLFFFFFRLLFFLKNRKEKQEVKNFLFLFPSLFFFFFYNFYNWCEPRQFLQRHLENQIRIRILESFFFQHLIILFSILTLKTKYSSLMQPWTRPRLFWYSCHKKNHMLHIFIFQHNFLLCLCTWFSGKYWSYRKNIIQWTF